MRFLQRKEPEPAAELPTGLCPRCEGGRLLFPFCDFCDNHGTIAYSPTWTAEEDQRLRDLIGEGRSETCIGIAVRRPVAAVYARMRALGLESSRPEPDGFLIVHLGADPSGPVVNPRDPVEHDQAVRP